MVTKSRTMWLIALWGIAFVVEALVIVTLVGDTGAAERAHRERVLTAQLLGTDKEAVIHGRKERLTGWFTPPKVLELPQRANDKARSQVRAQPFAQFTQDWGQSLMAMLDLAAYRMTLVASLTLVMTPLMIATLVDAQANRIKRQYQLAISRPRFHGVAKRVMTALVACVPIVVLLPTVIDPEWWLWWALAIAAALWGALTYGDMHI